MHWLWDGLRYALIMTWETFWALVLGFGVSAALQVFVSKEQMERLFRRANLRSVALAAGFGAASSSCSYAAAAAARSAFKQGAALIPALAFMFASTNLVVELGVVLWRMMGGRFVLAEVIGAFVLIGFVWGLGKLIFPRGLEQEMRQRVEDGDDAAGCCHHSSHGEEEHGGHQHGEEATNPRRWQATAEAFAMDWSMLWKEIAVGFLIAGYLMALVPTAAWRGVFLQGGPPSLRLLENACVGPLIAMGSFVCSVGNVPLANVLWSGGISFGGVISFIYGDLLIVPLILIYRKYYGARAAVYITAVFYLAMVGAGIVVDLVFTMLRLTPSGPRPPAMMEEAHFRWNYTTWLDVAAIIATAILWYLRSGGQRGESVDVTQQAEQRSTSKNILKG